MLTVITLCILLVLMISCDAYVPLNNRIISRRNRNTNDVYKSIQTSRDISLHAKATYKVTVQHAGKETVINVREDCSVLSAALDAGIDLPHDCDLGVCLTCPSKIVSGTVDQTGGTLDDSVIAQGFALTCCSYPRSDVVIRSIEEDELVSAQFARET